MLQKTNVSLTSHHIFANLNVKKNAIGRDRVPSLHVKEVCFETGFSLSVFSKTTKVEFAERGPRTAGGVSTTARNEGFSPWYAMH